MTETPTENQDEAGPDEIHSEINTDVSYDGEGTVYAVRTVRKGDRRVDWKIGHIGGTFAEGTDYYYKGELVHSNDFTPMPENAPLGRYKDSTFHELLDSDFSVENGKAIEKKVYDFEGVDTADWATRYLDTPQVDREIINGWWEDYVELE